MGKAFPLIGRTTPFIFVAGLFVNPAFATPRGHWLFVDDGTGIEVRSCDDGAAALCGVITRLPKDAVALHASDREALCGAALLGDLRPAKAKDGESARFDGWVVDIEAMTGDGRAPRYAASFVVLSETRARLDVRDTLGIVIERHQLLRAVVPGTRCG